jgi:PAS domain S-box-containing protein
MYALESSSDAIGMADKNGNHFYQNRAFGDLFGYELEDFEHIKPLDLYEDMNTAEKVFKEIISGGMIEIDTVMVRKDKSKFTASLRAYSIKDENGSLIGLIGIHKDITDKINAERALKESEERFMNALYSSDDAILLISGNSFAECNEKTSEMLNYKNREDFLNTHPSKVSPKFQPDGEYSYSKAERMMDLAFKNGFHRFEWIHLKASGEEIPIEVSLTPIILNKKAMLYCVWRDQTEIKRTQMELAEKREQFELAIRGANDGFSGLEYKGKHLISFTQMERTTRL